MCEFFFHAVLFSAEIAKLKIHSVYFVIILVTPYLFSFIFFKISYFIFDDVMGNTNYDFRNMRFGFDEFHLCRCIFDD